MTDIFNALTTNNTIVKAVRQHAAGCPQSDDIGIVCFRRLGDASHHD